MKSPRLPHRRTALLQLGTLLALASLHTACAAVTSPWLDMVLVDRETGASLTQYPARGRLYSPGTPGSRYAVRLVNRSGERLLVVLSVDGVNAITGDTAAWGQSGYVLSPGEVADITGWRKSDQHIAAFEFTSLGDSYAARTGRPAHVGVVGAAVFREVPPPPVVVDRPPLLRSERLGAADAPSAVAKPASPLAESRAEASGRAEPERADRAARAKLGTGHGASEWSPIQHTGFQRRTAQPEQLLEIHYDSQPNLMAAGIIPRAVARLPQPFPGSGGYVPDPPPRW